MAGDAGSRGKLYTQQLHGNRQLIRLAYLQQMRHTLEATLMGVIDGNASRLQAPALHADAAVANPALQTRLHKITSQPSAGDTLHRTAAANLQARA